MKSWPYILIFVLWNSSAASLCPKSIKYLKNSYASGFLVAKVPGGELLKIGENIFYNGNKDALDCYPGAKVLLAPSQMGVVSSTHISFIELLGALSSIKGVSEGRYINNEFILDGLSKGTIVDLKSPLSIEQILLEKISFITYFSLEMQIPSERLFALGISNIEIREYLENHPLGRLEWIKVFGIIFKKFDESVKMFNKLVQEYAGNIYRGKRKKILIGEIQGGAWVAPSNQSDFVHILNDAGGDNILEDMSEGKSMQRYSLEKIISILSEVDIWLPQNRWASRDEAEKDLGKYFKIFFRDHYFPIIINNKKINANGWSEYWELATVRPDLLIDDLSNVLKLKWQNSRWYKSVR